MINLRISPDLSMEKTPKMFTSFTSKGNNEEFVQFLHALEMPLAILWITIMVLVLT